MSEYIKREDALNLVIEDSICPLPFFWLIEAVSNLTAADVAEVQHGRWELRHVGAGHYWECSVCHKNPCIYVTKDTNYCPNCGAKMDVED